MGKPAKLRRREFLGSAATAVGLPYLVPCGVLGAPGKPGGGGTADGGPHRCGRDGHGPPEQHDPVPQRGESQHRRGLRRDDRRLATP